MKHIPITPQNQPFPEEYYELLEREFGREKADWARLPYEQRMEELERIHASFNTQDDLSHWPPELGGDADAPGQTGGAK
ncbi:hypothetical protein QPK87_13120 [Kamptonema cortianum]|uniref:Uncharacterized protein n=1 Tax=Geitlerinema calcuttense NRMC-F 0142 TaxID=2922238 RepID=A0ABT7LZV9_9CYAN|nr:MULTISPECIES: hypothetical protein [Cyanophyceae]MDK3157509.1 hypothetical protein [Kamptonema cortianum]MDL5052620.1 hypothetical protein [Oscillatoria laete-virens NRMC-F 0139]MDL5056925.1 hypothetical protein [Geitlerinema calcuttense NRMC-F 0142]